MEHRDQNTSSTSKPPLRSYNSLPNCPDPPNSDTSAARTALQPNPSARRRQAESGGMAPFAGRLGGNQSFVLDRFDPANAALLKKVPDAAPNLNLREMFDFNGFREVDLYKAAVCECFGTMILVFGSTYNSLSPGHPPPQPSLTTGAFGTVTFLGPLVASCINTIIISILIFCFGAISGAHFNPLITFATFFARLATFPRLVLYLAAQTGGGALAGLLLRAAAGTRYFKVGGCFLFTDAGARVSSQFVIEFVGSLLLIVMAFGVGLDPRQKGIFGPALAPILVGLSAGACALCFSFSMPGSGGAGLNPARCFGAFVGSRFPGWHWIHWIGPLGASILHGIIYFVVPPGSVQPRAPEMMVVEEVDEKRSVGETV
ncbi:aquaporin-like protein [Exophiala viscosa]|uniref:Aquaporin-like protein n=1 Tax=Exophiala viscosa TaxID=2486360 RepID=A0AAN6E6S8_9EURO|nr:aquaporin-like protein [Exophiala viscosa]KAI1627655.1 aquaporin-like protein [Exophiala viscosa]